MILKLPEIFKSFYSSASMAKAYNYRDLAIRQQCFVKINEVEKKVENKKREIENYINIIEEKENCMMGFRDSK
jgi:hypothetical protein